MFDFEEYYAGVAESLPRFSTIAEVGVANGSSAIFLAEALLNMNKRFKFYFIDSLSYGQEYQHREILRNTCEAELGEWCEIIPASSVEASCMFPDNHFEFVFIDASHKFEWTKADVRCWYPKVKDHGILAGHDYNSEEGAEVKQAIDICIPKNKLDIVPTAKACNVWQTRKLEGSLCY